MSSSRKHLSDHVLRTTAAYRERYEAVERALEAEAAIQPELPGWVNRLDEIDLQRLWELSPEVANAERQRRTARAAMYAAVELLALDDPEAPLSDFSDDDPTLTNVRIDGKSRTVDALSAKATGDTRWLRVLDRFIGVVQRADRDGCMFVNGTFEPVNQHELDDQEFTNVADLGRR